MPELPEVETVRRGLAPALEGARLIKVEARRPDLRFALPDRFVDRLTGARVERLGRRGKYLLATLDSGETLISHLGMSGRYTISPPAGASHQPGAFHHDPGADDAHTHVLFETDAGALIAYNDPRRFGYMDLIATAELEGCAHFKGMGPEPLSNSFSPAHLQAAFSGRKQSVKACLLDQRIVAGLGNIYVCEALHQSRISPTRAAGQISAHRLSRLAGAIRTVLEAAIAAGGSTLRDFAAADGALGYFQHAFQVYDREGAPCPSPGCDGVVKRIVQNGRSTFFCPRCQR
jgi:formamidopyrimidine-DNA glycosylase